MTTTTTNRPLADNEFPVLMRLPDLNAPVWAAPLVAAPTPSLNTATAAVSSNPSPPSSREPFAAPEVLPKTTGSVAVMPSNEAKSVEPESIPLRAESPAPPAPAERTPLLARLQPYLRADVLSTSQWTLVRQIAGGAVLVGGLALTYMLIMSGGTEKVPDHIPVAQQTTEPPLIEMAGGGDVGQPHDGPVVLDPAGDSDVHQSFANVQPPPEFANNFNPTPPRETASHIRIAEHPPEEPPPAWHQDRTLQGNPRSMSGRPTAEGNFESSTANDDFRGRIDPDVSSTTTAAPRYPETNPETYLYRPSVPNVSPDTGRPYEARLQGTIAPPPLR